MPTFGSLFSGIGGMDLGLERAGWECKWQVEIDDWRRQVLTRHWPEVPKWKDVREFPALLPEQHGRATLRYGRDGDAAPQDALYRDRLRVDLICAGVPCQDVSVAGRRAGLAGERTGLFFEFARILRELQPRWFLFENVPGLLSSNQGLDFAVILDTLDECGYGVSWRILNSQFFGVPQRRRRVFIVGHLGAPCPPEILFESEGGGGNPQTGGETGESIAHALRSSPRGVDEHTGTTYVAAPLEASDGHHGYSGPRGDGADNLVAQPLRANRWGGSDSHGDEGNVVATDAFMLRTHNLTDDAKGDIWLSDKPGALQQSGDMPNQGQYVCAPADPHRMLQTPESTGWLDACSRCPDGRRYAALGDAVTAVVAGWIGRRILKAME